MKRNSAYDLMKIISMFLIVLCHMINHGGIIQHVTNPTLKILIQLIFLGTLVHVNSFVLVTGYYQHDKSFRASKIWKLINASMFYKIIIMLIFVFILNHTISSLFVFKELMPFNLDEYWFIKMYIFLYFLSPFINVLIKHLNQKKHIQLLSVMFFIFSILPYVTGNQAFSNDGYTLYHFIFLYLIGAYLKKYPLQESYIFKYISKNMFQLLCILFFLFGWLGNFIVQQAMTTFANTHPIVQYLSNNLMSMNLAYSNPFIIIQSISYVLFFSTLNFHNRIITKISALTLGVYLIHEHSLVRNQLYTWLGMTMNNISSYSFVIKMFGVSVFVFVICMLVELVRQLLFKLIYKQKFSQSLCNKYHLWIENLYLKSSNKN